MITERTIQDMAASLEASAQRIADLLADRAALLAFVQRVADRFDDSQTGEDARALLAQVDR